MRKVTLILPEREFHAVYALASRELRTPNDQIVWLIRQEAARHGLLETNTPQEHSNEEAQSH